MKEFHSFLEAKSPGLWNAITGPAVLTNTTARDIFFTEFEIWLLSDTVGLISLSETGRPNPNPLPSLSERILSVCSLLREYPRLRDDPGSHASLYDSAPGADYHAQH